MVVDISAKIRNHWLSLLKQSRAIAVIRSSDVKLAIAMAKAVAEGGIRLIEITWNSSYPSQIINQLNAELPECSIGAGTILTPLHLQEAISCGSRFCFTPHVNGTLIQLATESQIPIIPGALSPTEIVTAWQAGASCVKVFPIGAVGGVNYIKSLQGPLGEIPLIPTGGVTLENAKDFITAGAIAVGLSGELFPTSLLESRNWPTITQRTRTLLQKLIA